MDIGGSQQDSVSALAQQAIDHANAALRGTLGDSLAVSLSTARLTMSVQEVATSLGPDAWRQPAVAVRQSFDGSLAGSALLVFCEAQSLHLVRALLADTVPLSVMTDLEQDALTELGNVVLNAVLASLAAQLGIRLTGTLPHYLRDTASVLMDTPASAGPALCLDLDFSHAVQSVRGWLLLTFQADITACLLAHIDSFQQTA